ncbi:protein translocase subunit SecD [Gemmatimonas groenlandica]|uniref:Protein translocase subunit SecD n=1 Tax=Gemmatimonas groenlandica TaxID=2732249 RepID=A0A6M4IMK5_9BACT|nr:protein translocase subunit SecD [Gemmatimonas groenlandica]QJR35138.1 protein translocase subunit SecD [Gemmatimonas groenlandica]
MANLKYRILLIVGLFAASAWALFPRTVVERVKRDGVFVYDTVRRVPLKRGLDLQGGMHLTLEVDESKQAVANKSEALDRALKVVRQRIDEFGVSEPVVQKAGTERIIVELPGIDDAERAQDVVQKSAFLEFQITDKTQAFEKVMPRFDEIAKNAGLSTASQAKASGDTTKKVGVTSLLTQKSDSSKDSTGKAVATTGADSAATTPAAVTGGLFSSSVQAGQIPGQYIVPEASYAAIERALALPAIQGAMPPGKVMRWGVDSLVSGTQRFFALYVLDSRPIITGEVLTDARPSTDPVEGNVVQFTLNNEGARRFKVETGKHVKDNMAIVLDQRVVTAPVLNSAIGRNGQITLGGGTLQSAQDLALVLRAGALPVPLKVAEVRSIGASLGADSINKGALSLAVAFLLIVVILVGYYRFSGMLAVAALVLYLVYTLAVLAGFNAVLTLPGLAGFVLSIGIAVDANVLIFERIREELDHGKSNRLAIDEGFRHALSAIVDTSATTILSGMVLYQYGTGPVRGFAVTLIAGLVASLFTAIFVSKTFFMIWLSRTRGNQTLSI